MALHYPAARARMHCGRDALSDAATMFLLAGEVRPSRCKQLAALIFTMKISVIRCAGGCAWHAARCCHW
jgi:hypothetical protein